jgi:hypothetical protein
MTTDSPLEELKKNARRGKIFTGERNAAMIVFSSYGSAYMTASSVTKCGEIPGIVMQCFFDSETNRQVSVSQIKEGETPTDRDIPKGQFRLFGVPIAYTDANARAFFSAMDRAGNIISENDWPKALEAVGALRIEQSRGRRSDA